MLPGLVQLREAHPILCVGEMDRRRAFPLAWPAKERRPPPEPEYPREGRAAWSRNTGPVTGVGLRLMVVVRRAGRGRDVFASSGLARAPHARPAGSESLKGLMSGAMISSHDLLYKWFSDHS